MMSLHKGLTKTLTHVEKTFIFAIHIKRIDSTHASFLSHLYKHPPHRFVDDKGILNIIFPRSDSELTKVIDRVLPAD